MFWESDNRPTAIFASRGLMAMCMLALLAKHNISVPAEMSVCGYDDLPAFAFTYPSLTTIRQSTEEYGKEAVKMLIEQIKGNPVSSKVFPVQLIKRQSAGPVK